MMERLDCHVKEYTWGKDGANSEVGRLFAAGHNQFRIDDKTPYAELWMGTHPDGPAKIRSSSERLSRLIAKGNHYELSDAGRSEEVHLPFIMKIMSIKHTLSLQVHPTKAQAAVLHEQDPVHYPDRNHKPELAYALTRFELLCGFRPAEQIAQNMEAFPELCAVMGEHNCRMFLQRFAALKASSSDVNPSESAEMKALLRHCFAAMLQLQAERPAAVEEQLKSLFHRTLAIVRGCLTSDTVDVMRDTYARFPSDVGCFAPLYLNHMILEPGECCYYGAEELHAYLSGECVECVGCSNNTIRAGLTPKYVDRGNLIRVLNYRMADPSFYIIKPTSVPDAPYIVEFAPTDCDDFTLHEIRVPPFTGSSQSTSPTSETDTDNDELIIPALGCPSIIVVVEGHATLSDSAEYDVVKRGDIFYIPPSQCVRIRPSRAERFLAYRTFSYEPGPDHSKRIVVGGEQQKRGVLSPAKDDSATLVTNDVTETANDDEDDIARMKKKFHAEMYFHHHNGGKKPVGDLFGHVIFDVSSEMDGLL